MNDICLDNVRVHEVIPEFRDPVTFNLGGELMRQSSAEMYAFFSASVREVLLGCQHVRAYFK